MRCSTGNDGCKAWSARLFGLDGPKPIFSFWKKNKQTNNSFKEGLIPHYLKALRMQLDSPSNMHYRLRARSLAPKIPTPTYSPRHSPCRKCYPSRMPLKSATFKKIKSRGCASKNSVQLPSPKCNIVTLHFAWTTLTSVSSFHFLECRDGAQRSSRKSGHWL